MASSAAIHLLRSERRRLRRAFGAALLAVATPGSWLACSEGASNDTPDAASIAPADASRPNPADGGVPKDAGVDVDCAAIHVLGCAPRLDTDAAYFDEAQDAEICPLLLPCGLPSGTFLSGCDLDDLDGSSLGCRIADTGGCTGNAFDPLACGQVGLECHCDLFVGGGRRPSDAPRARCVRARTVLGAYFARMAFEEAASIRAFGQLAMELRAHGAPHALRDEVRKSRRDEVHHADTMTRFAAEHGATTTGRAWRGPSRSPMASRSAPSSARALDLVAAENAAEGCVRETYGALVACWQASHAGSSPVRRVFARIAADETRHAALAWAIAAWLDTRLEFRAKAVVARARSRALRDLRRQVAKPVHEELVRRVGMPTPAQAGKLLAFMEAGLYRESRAAHG